MASDRGVRPVRLTIADDLRRNRATVFFRFLLALPLMVWLVVWAVGAFVVAVVNWGATLVLGRSPSSLHRFLARFVRYATHAFAYLNLAGGIVWAGAVGAAGWALGAALTGMLQRAAHIEELLGLGVVTALLFTLGWKLALPKVFANRGGK